MPRPGVNVKTRATAPARSAPTNTGVWFVAGITERGRTDAPVKVRNLGEFTKHFGGRTSWGTLYDALDTFFHEGGAEAVVQRVVGPAATLATIALTGAAAAASIAVDAIGAGTSVLSVQAVAGEAAGTFRLVILDNGVEVERSIDLASPAEAVAWGLTSDYVRVRATGSVNPTTGGAAVALAGGNDDRAAITDTHRTAALAKFLRNLGPGQVSIPGATTIVVHTALLQHAESFNRFALLDAPDSASDATVEAAATAIRAAHTDANGTITHGLAPLAPWVTVPGVVRGTVRTVAPSALVAGLIARSDTRNGPNTPAAGVNGEAQWAIGLSQPEWTDTVRERLNLRGITVIRPVYGAVRVYGWRTAAPEGTSSWVNAGHARTRMAITAEADALGEAFLFAQIDGRGQKVAEFGGALNGMLQRFYANGSLYGESAAEAFSVDVGPGVNTPTTLGNNELRAVLTVRVSPFAEVATIEIVKVPITENLAA